MVINFSFIIFKKLSDNSEIDFLQHVGCFVAEVSKKARYRFRLFDGDIEFIDERIA